MFALRNTADDYKLNVDEMRALALELAAVCPNNNPKHAENCFEYTGGRSQTRRRQLIAHLRTEASKKNPAAYAEWLKPLREASIEADPLMEEVKKLDWGNSELAKYKEFILAEARSWIVLMRKADEHSINEYTDARAKRMKDAHLPINRKFYVSDKKSFHKAYLRQFTEDTIIAVVNGGETIWITADFVESDKTTYIKQLSMCPMSHKSEAILTNIVNSDWAKQVAFIVIANAGNGDHGKNHRCEDESRSPT
jgi:hypothetical protein